MTEKPRIVITGLGVVAPNGIGKEEFWKALRSGKSGIRTISHFDVSAYKTRIGGEVNGVENRLSEHEQRRLDRYGVLGVVAAQEALADAHLRLPLANPTRIGICIGSGLGGLLFHEEQIDHIRRNGVDRTNPLSVLKVMPSAISSHLSIRFGIRGPTLAVSTACASGSHAVSIGCELIRSQMVDVMIAGGAEAPLTPFTFAAYDAMSAMSRNNAIPCEASRPFDKDRDGFVMSEGAGILVLESWSHAQRRHASRYCEILGYSMNSDAYDMVKPRPDGRDIANAISLALLRAGLSPRDISYISAHGTSTKSNDIAETKAVKLVFGKLAYRIPISSIKSMIGHSLGAAGAIQLIAAVLSIKHRFIPPTINLQSPDVECDLDYVPNKARRETIQTVLSNAFGFGGTNSCIVIGIR